MFIADDTAHWLGFFVVLGIWWSICILCARAVDALQRSRAGACVQGLAAEGCPRKAGVWGIAGGVEDGAHDKLFRRAVIDSGKAVAVS